MANGTKRIASSRQYIITIIFNAVFIGMADLTTIVFTIGDAAKSEAFDVVNNGIKLVLKKISAHTTSGTEVGRWDLTSGNIEPLTNTLRFSVVFTTNNKIDVTSLKLWYGDSSDHVFAVSEPVEFSVYKNVGFILSFGLKLEDIPASSLLIQTDPNAPLAITMMNQHVAHANPHTQYAMDSRVTSVDNRVTGVDNRLTELIGDQSLVNGETIAHIAQELIANASTDAKQVSVAGLQAFSADEQAQGRANLGGVVRQQDIQFPQPPAGYDDTDLRSRLEVIEYPFKNTHVLTTYLHFFDRGATTILSQQNRFIPNKGIYFPLSVSNFNQGSDDDYLYVEFTDNTGSASLGETFYPKATRITKLFTKVSHIAYTGVDMSGSIVPRWDKNTGNLVIQFPNNLTDGAEFVVRIDLYEI